MRTLLFLHPPSHASQAKRIPLLLFAFLCLAPAIRSAQDDRTKTIASQKAAAVAAWKEMDVGEAAHVETKHLLLYAPKSMDKRLKSIAAQLEKYHDTAAKALTIKEDDYPGKITVYLFSDRASLPAFIRRIEKRRPMEVESGSFSALDDRLHAVAVPGSGPSALAAEFRAGEMIAALLLQRKAGVRTEVPDWLTSGFGHATSHRVLTTQRFITEEKKIIRVLVRKRNASDAYNGKVEGDEATILQASVAELLLYGLTTARAVKILDGFKPGENETNRTTAQALEAANLTEDQINKAWKKFVK